MLTLTRAIILSGPLLKLGGRNKDRWEERNFELKNTGLYWCASSGGTRTRALGCLILLHPDDGVINETKSCIN